MRTLEAAHVDTGEVETLTNLTSTLPQDSTLRDFLDALVRAISAGQDVSVLAPQQPMTPAEAAKWLGVSRVHVYKLMDRGDLPFVRVGSDRRTTFADVEKFQATQEDARRDFARRAARPDETRRAAAQSLSA